MRLAVSADDAVQPSVPVVQPPTTAPVAVAPNLSAGGPPVLPDTTVPTVSDPVAAPVTQPQTQPIAQPQTLTVGYAYPAVWLLPLAFLVLVPLAARALTKDLAPATS